MILGMVTVEDLSDAEKRVWGAFPTGRVVDFSAENAEEDNPAEGESWGLDRRVRAEVLIALLCGAVEVEPGQPAEINLYRARVIGKLRLPGATLKHGLRLNECYLADGVDLSEATTRRLDLSDSHAGPILLDRTKINAIFALSGAHLNGKDGPALSAQDLTAADMFCDGKFQADGTVNLDSATVGGQLSFTGAHLNGKDGPALSARRLAVTEEMFCDEGFQAEGMVSLARAKVGDLVDDKGSWPQVLNLDGLTYGGLTYLPARERLDWLNRSAGYSPQPYEQLAGHYRGLGHDEQARYVLLAKQRKRTRQRPWWARWWGWLQDILAGYGYAPGRALLLLTGAFIAGWLVFRSRHPVPVGPGPHPVFNAALYTLDVLIPAPALGQASDWDPQGPALAVATGLHILGWLLAITVIAAITRSFSRT